MPGGDGTGPRGMGAMTGRAAGYCAGSPEPGYVNPVPGRGYGLGTGRGWRGGSRGWRHQYYVTGAPGWMRYGYAPAWGRPPAFGPYAPPYAPEVSREQEAEWLKGQAESLKGQLDAITQRIEELQVEET